MRARFVPALVAAALTIAACTAPTTASPELNSLLEFAAYPGAPLINEQVYAGSMGPFGPGARSATRTYRITDDTPEVVAHYRALATQHGWKFTAALPQDSGTFICSLSRDRYVLDITREWTDRYVPPTPPPIEPSPSFTPSPAPDTGPTPTPSATPLAPYNIQVQASIN